MCRGPGSAHYVPHAYVSTALTPHERPTFSPSRTTKPLRNSISVRRLAGLSDVVHSIVSTIFSAAIRVGKLVLAHGTTGKIEASTTRKPWTPLTRPWLSTTAIGSSTRPMRHEHEA